MSLPDEPSETIEATCPQCRVTTRYPAMKKGTTVECAVCSAQVGIGLPTATMLKPPSVPTINLEPAGGGTRTPRLVPVRKSPVFGILAGLVGLAMLSGVAAAVYVVTQAAPETSATGAAETAATEDRRLRDDFPIDEKSAANTEPTAKAEPPKLPERDDTKKSLVAAPTTVKDFRDAGKTPVEHPEKSYVPVPVSPPPPVVHKVDPIVPVAPKAGEATPPVAAALTPAPIVVRGPMLIPRPKSTIAAHLGRSSDTLIDYEAVAGTPKGTEMIDRKQIVLIDVPTRVDLDGASVDKLFTYVRPKEGRYKGQFLIVRTAKVTLPKK